MKQTKHSTKSEAHNLLFKMSTLHANTRIQTTMPLRNCCRDDGVVQQPPLPRQMFFQLLHIMDLQMVDPVLKYTPVAVVQIWQIGWPHLWRDKLWHLSLQHGDCHVHGERHDFSDVNITSPGWRMYMARNIVKLPVWLVFICKVVYQKS